MFDIGLSEEKKRKLSGMAATIEAGAKKGEAFWNYHVQRNRTIYLDYRNPCICRPRAQ
jgi:hypothetical protein